MSGRGGVRVGAGRAPLEPHVHATRWLARSLEFAQRLSRERIATLIREDPTWREAATILANALFDHTNLELRLISRFQSSDQKNAEMQQNEVTP